VLVVFELRGTFAFQKAVSIPEQKAFCISKKIIMGDGREESNYGIENK
jgi:hypothetical protein